ncbi:LacI family transcriptional regulator [Limimaricola pyoseonensis]|uniref:Transcriptional regulator, LacI family n=1 Tax=Limimaricola pyoseonensis TaxID=521013 RepID=A0A1G7IKD9_9RHOB|nr:LacI family transcriptional regulator [Limimaricola pyoseonensis]SDF13028.1 transcriptional regulator, LacI family [Limimaricola pyoseonensis]
MAPERITEAAATSARKKPTLKTISELSGLAVATVSRALSDAPDIGAETKERVRRIAAEIGYVPNRAGVRLRTGRTNVVSLVMSTEHEMMNMTARLISAVAEGLRGTPYHLNMTPYFPGDDPMKPIRYIVETRSADAIIFNQVEPDDPRVAYLMERGFPFATHGRSNRAAEYAYFDFDNAAFARLGVEALAGKGRRRVLLIAPPVSQTYAGAMIEGASEAVRSQGVELLVADGVTSDDGSEAIRRRIAQLLQADAAIDGLLTGSPTATMAAVAAFEGCGRQIGRDFDVVAKEAIPFLKLFRREIMVVEEDIAKAGVFLAKAAVAAATDQPAAPRQFLDSPTRFDV